MTRGVCTISLLLLAAFVGAAQADNGLADARARIEKHRKGPLVVRVTGANGQPIAGATVKVRQTRSAVRFGCNMFMWDLCGEEEELYRSRFKKLFDMATLPFYWWDYEPRPDETKQERLTAMAEWCLKNDITPKGHPLFWNHAEQGWLPAEPEQLKRLTLEHVEKIAKQYGDKIQLWDAVNEATNFERKRGSGPKLTGMWEQVGQIELTKEVFAAARRGNPGAQLLINDYDTSEQYEKLVEGLRESDGTCPFDVIGIQSHMHQGAWPTEKIHDVCRRFGCFGVPLHFTEVTVLSGESGWGTIRGRARPRVRHARRRMSSVCIRSCSRSPWSARSSGGTSPTAAHG